MIGLKGSFILGALASDGLLIASDSRGNLFNVIEGRQDSLLYFDGVKKIFNNSCLALAFTGQGVIQGNFLEFYLKDFFQTWVIDYYDPILSFFTYLNTKFDAQVYETFRSQKIIGINYFEGSPQISFWDLNKNPNYSCITDGFIQSDKSSFNENYNKNFNSKELSSLIIDSISKYSNIGQNKFTINDDISILKISLEGAEWILYSEKIVNWTTYYSLREDILENKIPFTLIKQLSLEKLRLLI